MFHSAFSPTKVIGPLTKSPAGLLQAGLRWRSKGRMSFALSIYSSLGNRRVTRFTKRSRGSCTHKGPLGTVSERVGWQGTIKPAGRRLSRARGTHQHTG